MEDDRQESGTRDAEFNKRESAVDELTELLTRRLRLTSNTKATETPPAYPGPFNSLLHPPARAGPSTPRSEQSDVTMRDVSFPPIAAAPPVVEHPIYKGCTSEDKLKFMDAYETYLNALEGMRSTGYQPVIVPVRFCIQENIMRDICRFELMKNPIDVTDEEWHAYFKEAREPGEDKFSAYKAFEAEAKRVLKLDMALTDAKSRMAKLRIKLAELMERRGLEEYMHTYHPKKLVDLLLGVMEPPEFLERLKFEMEKDENKPAKKNVILFNTLATKEMALFMKANVMATPPRRPTNAESTRPTRVSRRGNRNEEKGEQQTNPKDEVPTNKGKTNKGPPAKCPKCGSEAHKVKDCPQVKPDEAERLLEEQIRKWKEIRQNRVGFPKISASIKQDTATVTAVVEGAHAKALLDTGADASMVSAGLVKAIQATGAYVNEARPIEPVKVCSVGGAMYEATRKVQLKKLQLTTPAGPLVIRDLECWVDEKDKSQLLTIGRPDMVRLGYSTEALLEQAVRNQKASPKPAEDSTPFIRMKAASLRTMREGNDPKQRDGQADHKGSES